MKLVLLMYLEEDEKCVDRHRGSCPPIRAVQVAAERVAACLCGE
jgi:hypothetical protein